MSIPLLIAVSIIMALVQIAMFRALPAYLKLLLSINLFIGIVVNLGLSWILLLFTGVGAIAGIAHLAGGVVFGLYLDSFQRNVGKVNLNMKYFIIPTPEIKDPQYSWIYMSREQYADILEYRKTERKRSKIQIIASEEE